jgi:uncharacterized protein with HEPN domain
MKRDPRAFLNDMTEAGQAIHQAIAGISLDEYGNSHLIRSSVEREFITIGAALTQLSQLNQALFGEIEQAPQIISFRNKLTHDYIGIDNRLVWGVITNNLPVLVDQCCHFRLDREHP